MEIRPATLDDASVITKFNIALALESENMTLDAAVVRPGVEAVLRDTAKGIYFAAYEGGKPLGVLMVTYEWSDWRNGNFWWLQSVYVHPAHRSKGVFKSLFAHVAGAAQKTPGVCGFRLYVEEHNVQAQQVYQRLNFRRTDYQVLERLFTR
jgi:ribosomal protein S18 acetylase RimI-like enzyme